METEFVVNPEEIAVTCQEKLHPRALLGLEMFNAGEYFEAHEELELAWRVEPRPGRELYRGILQVAVAYYHILRGNYRGAVKMFNRSRIWLRPFPDHCRGIDLAGFRQDFNRVEAALLAGGPENLARINRGMMRPIHYQHNEGTL